MERTKQPPRLDLAALYELATETERAALLGLPLVQVATYRGPRQAPARELTAASTQAN